MTTSPTLRDRIAEALISWTYRGKEPDPEAGILETVRANAYSRADAVLAVLPAPVDRTAVLHEAATAITEAIERDRVYSPRRSNDRAALGAAREIVLGLIDNPRPMGDETAAAAPQAAAPVQHAPGKAIRCPDCRDKGYTVCQDEPNVEACPPGCIACATDESHDPEPAAGAPQDGA